MTDDNHPTKPNHRLQVAKAIHNFQHTLKEVDVTLSARGGDTGTPGPK